ncbi:MAG TPA: nuclear transport factor 2 family protein [Longimicrobiaceae bacterium]|nr:nuclear transport factor 2 family protein [Longimicrobiaceae bacterium]
MFTESLQTLDTRAEAAMEVELQTLIDKDRIAEVVHRLFIATDTRDWEGVRACFADEVLFDMTSVAGGEPARATPRQITDGWEEGLRQVQAIHHQAGNLLVSPRGGEADAFCYGTATHYLPTPSGRDTRVFVGSYDFHLVRRDGRWQIDRFRFDLKFLDGNPNLEAEAAAG